MGISKHQCRVCGKKEFSRWGKRDNQPLYQCDYCELVFFFPYPTQEELTEFYEKGYHSHRGYSGNTNAGLLRSEMYQMDIRDLNLTLPKGGRFLDVGCAEGTFLSQLNSNWEKFGTDVSNTALSKASDHQEIKIFNENIDELPVEDEFFDVIHFRGVFEHILYPDLEIKKVKRKLKKGGTLILSNTPNIGGLVPRLFRGKFKLVLPNEHVNYYSTKTIQTLFDTNSFKMFKVAYPYFGTPYASFIKDLFSIGTNLLIKRDSPPFYGNIFTIYGVHSK